MTNIQAKEYKYLFSIIMAIYNVEKYLAEAIESVVNQSLDFESHTQLILVNDGSTDKSEEICLQYKEKFPNNIVYIKKENEGVSSARNLGLDFAEGKYVNFLDSDDKLSLGTLHQVFVFFEKNYNQIDFVSIPLYFFDGAKGPHILNYKFNTTRIINILDEYQNIQMTISSSFVKGELLEKFKFNTNLAYSEDADLLNRILLEKFKFGVLSNVKYHYRRRKDYSSAVQTGTQKKEWFTKCLTEFAQGTINYSLEKLGYIPEYLQYMIMYDLQWRFKIEKIDPSILSLEEQKEFFLNLQRVIKYVDDKIILEQKPLDEYRKIFALELKYDGNIKEKFTKYFLKDNVKLYFKDFLINSLKKQVVTLQILEIKNNKIHLEGFFQSSFNQKDYEIIIKKDEVSYQTQVVKRSFGEVYSLGKSLDTIQGFRATIPIERLNRKQTISVFIKVNNIEVAIEKLKLGRFTRLSTAFKTAYLSTGDFIVFHKKGKLVIVKNSFRNKLVKELRLLRTFYRQKKPGYKTVILARLAYHLVKPLLRNKPIWILMDRQDKADDNAEHLLKYALEQQDGIKKYFVIKKDCDDYERLKGNFPVVPFGSYKHRFLQLLADKVISSHADEFVINPFFKSRKYYLDLMKYDFVFLQHGIIQNDLSHWVNKYNKNPKMFVSSAHLEYQHIASNEYNYDGDVVKLTGLPRFDGLINKAQKQVLIMPTWRKTAVYDSDQKKGIRPYSPEFKKTEYFRLYNAFINDPRIIDKAKEKGYSLLFFPHPNIQQQIKDFTRNSHVTFGDYESTSYQTLFNESNLLITDFSSVAFDFAYMKKPVVYYQEVPNHLEFGYFDYETMGFGEVVYEYEKLVQLVIKYLENDCEMKNEYIKRVEDFYAYTDRNNCKRVYETIRQLDQE